MTEKPVTIAQIGCGYWGPNLLRNFSSQPNCRVKYVVDASAERRSFVESNFPRSSAVDSVDAVLEDSEVTAVVIATPAASHFSIAAAALRAGKHVFVEKPLATKVSEVDQLGELAGSRGLVVMVGHTFIYNSAVRYVKRLIDAGELGDIRYIYSQRLNLGRIRSDIDALWNFAPHDISIIQYWLNNPEPLSVRRQGMDYIQPGVEDVVFLNLEYPNKVIANVQVSWLDPQKVRKIVVVGSRKMVVYDDVADDKIAIYDKGIDKMAILGQNMDFDAVRPAEFKYRSGDILLPEVKFSEPLRAESAHFLDCVRNQQESQTGIAHARTVVSILEKGETVFRALMMNLSMKEPEYLQCRVVNVQFGDNVKVVQPVNLYGCCIGQGTFIGPFVEIQKDVVIGKNCRIQSHSFICELVTIGDDCFIAHGVMFINDLFEAGGPAKGRKDLWRSTRIGNRVSIGSNATILPVSICDDAVIGAGAVVTKDISVPGVYAGNPARMLRSLPSN